MENVTYAGAGNIVQNLVLDVRVEEPLKWLKRLVGQ